MGVSNNALLIFGVDLGEDLPEFLEENEYGFDDYIQIKYNLENPSEFPIDLHFYCSGSYPMYILGLRKHFIAYRGYVKEITSEMMSPRQEDLDVLKLFLNDHNIEGEPKWLLTGMNG